MPILALCKINLIKYRNTIFNQSIRFICVANETEFNKIEKCFDLNTHWQSKHTESFNLCGKKCHSKTKLWLAVTSVNKLRHWNWNKMPNSEPTEHFQDGFHVCTHFMLVVVCMWHCYSKWTEKKNWKIYQTIITDWMHSRFAWHVHFINLNEMWNISIIFCFHQNGFCVRK